MIVVLVCDCYSPSPLKPPATQTKLHHSVSFTTTPNSEVADCYAWEFWTVMPYSIFSCVKCLFIFTCWTAVL